MSLNHGWLMDRLDIDPQASGVFGICYSSLTLNAATRGCGESAGGFGHSLLKLVQGGHATTFLWVRSTDAFVKSEVDESGWSFVETAWARQSHSATTYVYYIEVDWEFIEKYKRVIMRLYNKGRHVRFSHFRPNILTSHEYHTCVSASHRLMYELGLGSRLMARGFWTPKAANWVTWVASFSPRTVGAYTWKYRSFPMTNTLTGGHPRRWIRQDNIDSIFQCPTDDQPVFSIRL